MADRLACLVPGCRRTCKPFHGEWICGVHWPATDRAMRRLLSLAKRRGRQQACAAIWRRLKRQAIERAVGI